MSNSQPLESLQKSHHIAIKEIYVSSINSLGKEYYTKEQIQAWSSLAWLPELFEPSLQDGKGWITRDNGVIAAFAVRYPTNRLALLYCRPCFARKGHATTLIKKIEQEAEDDGNKYLFTEASFFSYPLLKKLGWTVVSPEVIQIGGINFNRYLMEKRFNGF
tara:strand:- start:905 stop:1387 length:483 start_codon:yes stop_codon:yes gene_type:complete